MFYVDLRMKKHVRFGSIHPIDRSFVANGGLLCGHAHASYFFLSPLCDFTPHRRLPGYITPDNAILQHGFLRRLAVPEVSKFQRRIGLYLY